MASVARYYNLDAMTKNFLTVHERCNIVNLGAGLETAYFRLNSQNAIFYEIDLQEVIDSRRSAQSIPSLVE
jgi:O-methyltransferase involved in polyketide biosynthesis